MFYFVCSSELFDNIVKRLSPIWKHLRLLGVIRSKKYMIILSVSKAQSGLSLLASLLTTSCFQRGVQSFAEMSYHTCSDNNFTKLSLFK